ncbi:MAG: DUF5996 family protein [Pseudomonadota bacterium]
MQKWPDIPYTRWKDTGASLHMWLQVIGKFRLAQTPWLNHSWQATFYVTGRGLTTSLVPGRFQDFCVDLDFIAHEVHVTSTSGDRDIFKLEPMSVASFHKRFIAALNAVGAPSKFHGAPNELVDAIPFTEQTSSGTYDPSAAQDYWRALVAVNSVFSRFRTAYLGKSSPVHLFWGSLDLAVTRFSGRAAPLHAGGIPNLPDNVTQEAYSHEVSSAGFWAGGGGVEFPAFYCYAYPIPEGFKDYSIAHEEAYYDDALGEFLLPYDAVRNAPDPEGSLLAFLEATYEAAAETGGWPRSTLECALGQPGVPRPISGKA